MNQTHGKADSNPMEGILWYGVTIVLKVGSQQKRNALSFWEPQCAGSPEWRLTGRRSRWGEGPNSINKSCKICIVTDDRHLGVISTDTEILIALRLENKRESKPVKGRKQREREESNKIKYKLKADLCACQARCHAFLSWPWQQYCWDLRRSQVWG